ncbi:MAG: SGNH/GDSL hydrolase family protein [Fibrobacteres bacterium]|nr:SGNH/GDSL hydrolase family protein [Fibrobacterota bacterium]
MTAAIVMTLAAVSTFALDDATKNKSTEMNQTISTEVRENGGEIRVLILGNSIALHPPFPSIGWTNNWGMAASAAEKDFAHLTISGIEKRTGKKADYRIRNIFEMEKNYHNGYVIAKSQAEDISWKPDYVVIASGENVADFKNAMEQEAWGNALYDLGKVYKEANPAAKIVYRSVFWENKTKHRLAKEAAVKLGVAFADLGSRGEDLKMQAHDAGFSHEGIAKHPGDAGMAMQAEIILKALFD